LTYFPFYFAVKTPEKEEPTIEKTEIQISQE